MTARSSHVIHVVPGWGPALCGAQAKQQPADAVPNCKRCLAQLSGEAAGARHEP